MMKGLLNQLKKWPWIGVMVSPQCVLKDLSRVIILVSMVITFLTVYACSMIAEPQSWSFIESVGGIAVDPPVRADRSWVLPVRCDVSGLKTITIKPAKVNSGIACQNIRAEVEGSFIYLTVLTTIAGGGRNAECPPALLGQVVSGTYRVFYRGPNEKPVQLGEVAVGL